LPLEVVPSASTVGLYLLKYGSFLTKLVRSASCPFSPSVRASVNGTSKTVGRVPAASLAANVGPVHWYSTGLTLMPGLAFSNCAICALNCLTAAAVLPGMSDATLIVTGFAPEVAPTAFAHAISKHPKATATVVVLRVDIIVLLLSVDLIRFICLAKPDRRVLR
jgi:hypothetical protein